MKKKLGEITDIVMGQSPSSDSYNTEREGLPFFQGNADFGELHPKIRMYCSNPIRVAEFDDVLISVRAPIGAINIALEKCCIGRGLASVRAVKNKAVHKYIYYALSFYKEKLISLGTGSTFKAINKKAIADLEISTPSVLAQKQIVNELDTLSGIIAKKKAQIAELDFLAQATFYDMFGDPVANEKGWGRCLIKDSVASVNYGTSKPSAREGKFKYLRMNNITYYGHLDLTDMKYIDVNDKEIDKYVVKRGDLLFNRTNSKELVGKTAVFTEDEAMIIAGYIIRLRTNENFNPFYIWGHLNSKYGKAYLKKLCKSIIGMANINAQELQNIPVFSPPLPLQNQFAQRIEAIEQQKALIQQSINDVQQLFDATMDKFFN